MNNYAQNLIIAFVTHPIGWMYIVIVLALVAFLLVLIAQAVFGK